MSKQAFRIRLNEAAEQQAASSHLADRQQAHADRADLETLSLVASRSSNAILIMDSAGTIEWINEAFTRLSGYEEAVAVGHQVEELVFGPSTSIKTAWEFREAIRTGRELTEDILQYRSDGTTVWVQCELIPVRDNKGEVSRWIVIQTDVSRRHQAEEALRAAKQAAELNSRSKSEFLANMSHEIRTPLNAILGMTELALATDLTQEQRDYLQTVKTSADTLLELLNDVLDISKIEAGKLEIEEVDFNLAEVVRETLQAMAVRAHEKGLELAVHMPMHVPQELRGDPTRIRQVLFNLVGNAIKFTAAGEVVVDIEQQWQTDDEIGLHIAVTDTGIGIPKDRLKKIFDAFTQVDSSMARRFGGTGLGLTITAQLLRLMDGKIWVQSSEGKGSTFHFTLTLKLAVGKTTAPPRLDPTELQGRRVLIVDDNATNRRILDEMMTHWGMATELSDGAASALKQLEAAARDERPFHLLVLDAMMPVIDGFQLAEMIRQRPDLRPGTVMMLSSADRPSSTAKCEQLGIATYLVKPVSAAALLEAILTTLAISTERSSKPQPTRSTTPELQHPKPAKRLRILLVDDHATNRQLVEAILRRRGHDCHSEEDGAAALRAWREEHFDVVLMDVQMPGYDGFAATRDIREQEQALGMHTPIIALTAHALKGDRERCLAAGMDAYLAKPIHAAELIAVVEQIGDRQLAAAEPVEGAEATTEPMSVFSISAALERMGGEMDLLREHLGYVLNDIPQLLRSMHQALDLGDARQLEIAAHRTKSLVSSYDHHDAHSLTQQIEQDAKQGRLTDAAPRVEQLEPLLKAFARAANDYLQTS